MKYIIVCFFVCLFSACAMKGKVIERKYRKDSLEFRNATFLSNKLREEFDLVVITLRYMSDLNKIVCYTESGKSISNYIYISPGDYGATVMSDRQNDFVKVAGLDERLVLNENFRNLLSLYQKMGIKALMSSSEGVFFAMASSIKFKNPELESGIFISTQRPNEKNIIKKIESDVFVYEIRVR